MKPINLLIVDDREIIRDSLKLVFSRSKDIHVKGEASDGLESIEMVKKYQFDVVLMDIHMPLMSGIEATRQIIEHDANIKVLGNSFYLIPTYIQQILKVGASGFITKEEDGECYIEAVRSVSKGKIYLSDKINYQGYDKIISNINHSA
jgi:two-component system, NarL family, response regulator DegU